MKKFLILSISLLLVMGSQSQNTSTHRWYKPDYFNTQFAGDIGMVSAGVGFQNSAQTRNYIFSVGYIPSQYVDNKNDLYTLNSTFQYQPFFLHFQEINVRLTPLILGISGSVSLGKQFTKYHDSNYPQGYYWWPNNFRIIVSVGHSGYYQFSSASKSPVKAIELYSQLTTNDLALYSYSENTIVKFKHIVHFAFGAKIYWNYRQLSRRQR